MLRDLKIDLNYQAFIDAPPARQEELYAKACGSDNATVEAWRETWLQRTREAKELFKDFGSKSIGTLHGANRFRPAIVCGSGPSLKQSIKALKENAESEHPVLNVSCLHNFGYFEDEGFHADYYLSLDAGEIVVADVFEGRNHPPEHYWEKTKGKKLLASVMSPKKLFELWQGEIFLFTVMIPDVKLQADLQAIEKFSHYISCGGNALGGCFYAAKCIMGSDTIHFVGADFCFDYDNKFHSYATHYDNPGHFVPVTDVFGMPRKTWQSYLNFKYWFDWVACNIPGRYVNCSEGILGAYKEGNIRQFDYMPLDKALTPYKMVDRVFLQKRNPATGETLSEETINLKELFQDSKYPMDIAII